MFLWPDGFWCFRHEFNPGFLRNTDYQIVVHLTDDWLALEKRGLITNIRASR